MKKHFLLKLLGFWYFIMIIFMCSCVTLQPIEQRPYFEIEWPDTNTITPCEENLFVPDINIRKIVGISKNGKRYKVLDGHGNKAPDMRDENINSADIGKVFTLLDEFRY